MCAYEFLKINYLKCIFFVYSWKYYNLGKVFPKLRRKGKQQIQDISNDLSSNTEESRDYVFQIISKARHEEFRKGISI